MVSKCANPECSVPFQYFREGKLFRIEAEGVVKGPATGPVLLTGKRRVEHYWLCGTCSANLTLAYDREKGVLTTPRSKPAARRARAS